MLNPNPFKKLKKVNQKKSYKPKSEGKLSFFTLTSIHESFWSVTFFWFDFFLLFIFLRPFKHFLETLEQNLQGMAKTKQKCFF
jgi:hypothetical protein